MEVYGRWLTLDAHSRPEDKHCRIRAPVRHTKMK
jgi:hypothetical protein